MEIIIFWIKKFVARILFPMPLFFELAMIGVFLCCWKKTRRAGVAVSGFAGILLFVMSQPYVSRSLLHTLENDYEELDVGALDAHQDGYVVGVAGNGYNLESGFSDDSLVRMQEAGRIAAEFEHRSVDYRIALSIYRQGIPIEIKRAASLKYFESFGVPSSKIVVEDGFKNSREEVLGFAKNPGRLILVSNAYHMPRLMLNAKRGNIGAIAAPAGYRAATGSLRPMDVIPSAEALNQTEIAVYEYLGIVEASL